MATEVSGYARDVQPYSCIGIMQSTFPDGTFGIGTCSLIGRNDILTATHLVYDPDHGGWANNFEFYFGADYNFVTGSFEDYGYLNFPSNWLISAWPNQAYTDANNDTMIRAETAYDIAIIGVNTPIGDTLGWLGINSGYNGYYSAIAVGYPVGATGMMQETVSVYENFTYGIYESNYNVMGSGSSGGPLLIGNYVIGVKSTASWWADVGFLYSNIVDAMNKNDSLLTPTASNTDSSVFRFYNKSTGTHFYTASQEEATNVKNNLPNFTFEGKAFEVNDSGSSDSIDIYRFYNTATSVHFYTAGKAEADNVKANLPTYKYEGVAFQAHSKDSSPTTTELYRFYNTNTGTHFYTASQVEMEHVKVELVGVMNYEGVAFYVDV